MYQKALRRHDSYKVIIPYKLLYVNKIQHYLFVFYAVFVVVFVGFMLVFVRSLIFGLTFQEQTAILVLEDFILYSKFELYKKLIP